MDFQGSPKFSVVTNNLSQRRLTAAYVDWNIPDWNRNSTKSDYSTPNLDYILHEVSL